MQSFSKHKAELQRYWRIRYREEIERRGEVVPAGFEVVYPDDGALTPPSASRVFRRSAILAAMGLRSLACAWEIAEQEEFLPTLQNWLAEMELEEELEASEYETLHTPAGKLEGQSMIDANWRWEGAGVFAAALGLFKLPPLNQIVDVTVCGDACGLLAKRLAFDRLQENLSFDSSFDRMAFANQALAIDWRLRQFVQVRQEAIDFVDYSRSVEWADFNLQGVRLADGDLAIGELPIILAAPRDIDLAFSIARERHQAANWLTGWDPVYSQVSIST